MRKPPERSLLNKTPARILEVAERLAQTCGFNGFSYADIAAELKITKASLHYHFATKAELGCALIVRYTKKFETALSGINGRNAQINLCKYVQLYENVLVRDRMCLCGMLAAEYSTLPPAMQIALRRFFDKNESWLADALQHGRAAETLHFDGPALEAARLLTAGLEGAMLLARSYEEPKRFSETAKRLLAQLGITVNASVRTPRNTQRAKRSGRRELIPVAVSR